MTEKKHRFEALSRICLNNWHYIPHRILSFHREINFFTGHSGSGKSTIIDAMQIVLYANTDGRGFFNKAAADDSDRSLIEYLRGMVNIGENNEFSYLRNHNFSSDIVLELERTDTGEKQCVGVVFDVDTATNDISRLFFWHTGPLWEDAYRSEGRTMTTQEVRRRLQKEYEKDRYYCGPHNERFRKQLYDIYLGGLDMDKFPLLFKRAIPFKMNGRLEDFVKEYICMEQDIHIEEMQESVMQYGRLRKRIEDTMKEIQELSAIRAAYGDMASREKEIEGYQYYIGRLDILALHTRLEEIRDKKGAYQEEGERLQGKLDTLEGERLALSQRREFLDKEIASTGYEETRSQLKAVTRLAENLYKSRVKWDRAAAGLKEWEQSQAIDCKEIFADIERFARYEIDKEGLEHLKNSLFELQRKIQEEKKELDGELRDLKREQKKVQEELKLLHKGQKAYPKELEEARKEIKARLEEKAGRPVRVEILADLLEIRDDAWRNAVEGYMGNNKLSVIVEPAYAKDAMEIYRKLDQKKYFRAAVLDTEKIQREGKEGKKGALSEEVTAKEPYVKAYLDHLLGNVMKCAAVEELRKHSIGITADCVLYQNFKLQHIDPDHYTKWAYIGADSLRRRIGELEKQEKKLEEAAKPLKEKQRAVQELLEMQYLSAPAEDYMEYLGDIRNVKAQEEEKRRLEGRLEELLEKDVRQLEGQLEEVKISLREKEVQIDTAKEGIWRTKRQADEQNQKYLFVSEELRDKEKDFSENEDWEKKIQEELEQKENPNYGKLRDHYTGRYHKACEEKNEAFQNLINQRLNYLRAYPNRSFSPEDRTNEAYDQLLDGLQCDGLERYQKLAKEQAESAVWHFKEDFMLKIRSAIREAMLRKDELNKIINKLDFGKDKYQFIFSKNKGSDGRFFDMFMDEALEIDPSTLTRQMSEQMNLFTMVHEDNYGDLMNELISNFIPPENAGPQELEAAKKNMMKYADYRTYMSFDMEQTIHREGEEPIKIRLSKMIKKNSGGEGQNPRYVALLASFAQAYHIGTAPGLQKNPTIRLVVLDEAFSKMDGEKVASCIRLIRDLGFQVIISATNDKIQNYLENVDKTFVFANPNKKSISIQEFEKKEFGQLEGV